MDSECKEKIENLKAITTENKTAVILNEVDAIQSRCISVQSSAIQQSTRLQRLLLNWNELIDKTQKIEDKLNQPKLSKLNALIISQSLSEDILEKKLLEHKVTIIFLFFFFQNFILRMIIDFRYYIKNLSNVKVKFLVFHRA
jgi:hypothetical protein